MEITESAIIGFLLVVIIILIFSQISVSFGSSTDNSETSSNVPITPSPTNRITPAPTKFDPQNSDLLSNDVKKQLKELDAMYYINSCKA